MEKLFNKLVNGDRILHITHDDLDAEGCATIAELYAEANGFEIDTHFCHIGTTDKTIEDILNENTYNGILITDIGVSYKMAERLDKSGMIVAMVDHHATNKLDQKYDWALVGKDETESATLLLYRLMKDDIEKSLTSPKSVRTLETFANKVSRYDMWEWQKHPTDYSEEDLNIINLLMGNVRSVTIFKMMIISPSYEKFIPGVYQEFVDAYKERRINSVERTVNNCVKTQLTLGGVEYTIGICIPSSEFFNAEITGCYQAYPELDIVFGLSPTRRMMSLRTGKDNINCGEIAANYYHGGGHAGAAGGDLDMSLFEAYMKKD